MTDMGAPDRPRRQTRPETIERNISDQVAATLGREIIRGVHPPGAQLPNSDEMCARFRVSRTALREAYSLLSAKALIAARPKTGTRVRPREDWNLFDPDVLAWHMQSSPTGAFIADLFVLRQMVEPAASALAAALNAPETTERIGAAYARMADFKDGSGDLIEADLDFHMGILRATGNPFLGALGGLIRASLYAAFRYSWEGAARIQDSRLNQHRLILEAIRAGAPDAARQRMRELLSDSLEDVRVFLVEPKSSSGA
ncbi:MAG TPA: FadR/GntR family transcriptional regulator [Roseiarcus sp.]|nr:FadR/GntR family transcriptional regulator [Roseiarcus sp.]